MSATGTPAASCLPVPHAPHASHAAHVSQVATERRLNRALRPVLLAFALGGAACASLPAIAAEAAPLDAAAARAYDIPAGPLGRTLSAFAAGNGIALSFDPALTEGLTSPALSGRYTPRDAVERLLAGSGLQLGARNDGSYTLRRHDPVAPAAPGAAAPSGAVTLQAVTVTADADRSGTTEGTGSYTTRATGAATGLALSLRDTPQSVSVLTRQQIDDQALLSLGQAMKNVTGVIAVSSDTDRTDFYARGFYIDNYQYDGVPTTVSTDFFGASNNDSVLYDRIEVVRGSTGLLTGAGNPSASINLVRKRADSKVFTGSASLAIGSWNQHRATVDLSTPVTEEGRVRARVVGMADERDSYIDRYHGRKAVLYGTVEADLTPATLLTAGFDYQANRPSSSTWGGLPLAFSDGTLTNWNRSTSVAADWTHWDTTTTTAFASLAHSFDNGWQLKANLSHRESEQNAKLLYLYGNIDRVTGTGLNALSGYYEYTFQQNNVDLQATGPFELFGRKHELVVGTSNSESRYVQANHARTSALLSTGNFYAWDGSYAEPTWGALRISGIDKTRQTGLYGAARFSLADSLKLIVGGRQTSWRTQSLTATRSHDVFTPYAGLIQDIDATWSAYASYTDIFQPQNYRDTNGNYLDPVTGKSYEAGVKGEHLGGRLNTSFSVFRSKQENVAQQDGTNLVPGSTSNAYYGAKGVVVRGFEAQVTGELTAGWNLSAGLARTLGRDTEETPINPWAPTTQLTLFSTYRLPGRWHALTVGGGVNWQNRSYQVVSVTAGDVVFSQKAYALASLMARYEFSPRLSLQLNVNNLFDKTYYNNLDGQAYFGAPRNALMSLNVKF